MRLHGGEDHSDPGVLEPRRSLDFADAESSEEGEVGLILVQLLMDKIQHHLVYLRIIFFFYIYLGTVNKPLDFFSQCPLGAGFWSSKKSQVPQCWPPRVASKKIKLPITRIKNN